MIKTIENIESLKEAKERQGFLIEKREKEGLSEIEDLEIEYLRVLIKDYEEKNISFGQPNPIEYLKYLLENNRMKQQDLANILGVNKATLSNLLSYRKKLSIEMIKALHSSLKIPYDILMQDYDVNYQEYYNISKILNSEANADFTMNLEDFDVEFTGNGFILDTKSMQDGRLYIRYDKINMINIGAYGLQETLDIQMSGIAITSIYFNERLKDLSKEIVKNWINR